MFAAQLVYTAGAVFAYWLFHQSTFVIGALCPWCLLVTVSTTLVFATLTHVNIRDRNLPLPRRAGRVLRAALDAVLDALAVTIWLLLLALTVAVKYGSALVA